MLSLFAEIIVGEVGAEILIPAQGNCQTINDICIAPEGSNAECYLLESMMMALQELNYNYTSCSNSSLLCLNTILRLAMNNTLFTVRCSRPLCKNSSSNDFIGATSKLIVTGKWKQDCFYGATINASMY